MDTSKGNERVNDKGVVETNVETVDYRTRPGQDHVEQEKIEITHLTSTDDGPGTGNIVTEATGKVAEKIQSAKEVISGSICNKSDTKIE